jgi:hypothetical protein
VPAVQVRDLHEEDAFDPAGLARYELAPSHNRYWARRGDLLFRSRGERNTAVIVKSPTNAAAVAILPLMVLRPDREQVEPAYLAWFINQPNAQRYFEKCAQGTRLKVIPKACLDELEVPVPDLATQRLIVEIDELARREHALSRELADKTLAFKRFALLRQTRNTSIHPVD